MLESLIASGEPVMFSGVSAVVELFPSPLPEKIPTEPDESEVEGAEDWFSTSHFFGTDGLFIPNDSGVVAKAGELEVSLEAHEFLALQFRTVSLNTIYYLINKIDSASAIAEILDFDTEYELDDAYDPEGWLNEYQSEYFEQGLQFLGRLRAEHADQLFSILADGVMDEDCGLKQHWESSLTFDPEAREKYADWPVRVAMVFEGKFFPYLDGAAAEGLLLDDFQISDVLIRNYDEG